MNNQVSSHRATSFDEDVFQTPTSDGCRSLGSETNFSMSDGDMELFEHSNDDSPQSDIFQASFCKSNAQDRALNSTNKMRNNSSKGARYSTSVLKAWLKENSKNPYPSKKQKSLLSRQANMTIRQISTWFANARRRLKKQNKVTWIPRIRSKYCKNIHSIIGKDIGFYDANAFVSGSHQYEYPPSEAEHNPNAICRCQDRCDGDGYFRSPVLSQQALNSDVTNSIPFHPCYSNTPTASRSPTSPIPFAMDHEATKGFQAVTTDFNNANPERNNCSCQLDIFFEEKTLQNNALSPAKHCSAPYQHMEQSFSSKHQLENYSLSNYPPPSEQGDNFFSPNQQMNNCFIRNQQMEPCFIPSHQTEPFFIPKQQSFSHSNRSCSFSLEPHLLIQPENHRRTLSLSDLKKHNEITFAAFENLPPDFSSCERSIATDTEKWHEAEYFNNTSCRFNNISGVSSVSNASTHQVGLQRQRVHYFS